jgi:hypothetical protein
LYSLKHVQLNFWKWRSSVSAKSIYKYGSSDLQVLKVKCYAETSRTDVLCLILLQFSVKITMFSETARSSVVRKATCIPTVIHNPCVQTVLLYRLSKTRALLFPDIPTTSGSGHFCSLIYQQPLAEIIIIVNICWWCIISDNSNSPWL